MSSDHENDNLTSTQKRVRAWFRAKRMEMLASAGLAQDHPTLVGSHREFFIREFLSHFLPGRLSADRGIVYNAVTHSGECDVVIWDSMNFPRLSMLDHSAFFIESAVAVVEVKSIYSRQEFRDCVTRCESLRRLNLDSLNPDSFENQFELLKAEVVALRDNVTYNGFGMAAPPLGYGVVFLRGGQSLRLADLYEDDEDLHEAAPDFVFFVEAGVSMHKYAPDIDEWRAGRPGSLVRYSSGDDVLLDLADVLLSLIRRRSFATDGLEGLERYTPWAFSGRREYDEKLEFPMTHFPHGRTHFFGEE